MGVKTQDWTDSADWQAIADTMRSVMPAHSRSKNGVASLAYVAGIHVLMHQQEQKRGWPGQARP